ncbi:MAG: ComF family protein [Clostridia bacterium]|nr:ComF family protein [Clostridia bacterium]
MQKFKEIIELCKKMLFPPHIKCIFCGAEIDSTDKHSTCEKCLKILPLNTGKVCTRCGHPVYGASQYCLDCKGVPCDYEYARAPFIYEEQIKQIIHKFKYADARYLSYALSAYLADEYILNGFNCDVCIAVPLADKRLKQRGYNQADLLALDFAKHISIPVLDKVLIRIKETLPQAKQSGKNRAENLAGAFKVIDKKRIKGKNILLIDDIYTTGTTVKECSKVLVNGGAKAIYVLTVAHTAKEIVYDAPVTEKFG